MTEIQLFTARHERNLGGNIKAEIFKADSAVALAEAVVAYLSQRGLRESIFRIKAPYEDVLIDITVNTEGEIKWYNGKSENNNLESNNLR